MGSQTDGSPSITAENAALQTSIPTTHPLGFYFIFWGEFAERCSYYGMRGILPLYLTSALLFEDGQAASTFSYFKSACYFLPLLGGFLADRYFGKYWTIVGFSVPYVLGHFILGIETNTALFFALALLAGGSGVIKPNISTLMGKTYDQKRPGQRALLTSAFVWFYFSINVGATLSLFALPQVRDYLVNSHLEPYNLKEETRKASDGSESKVWYATEGSERKEITKEGADALRIEANRYAYPLAFQIPAWLMVAALGAFAFGRRHYAVEVTAPSRLFADGKTVFRWVTSCLQRPSRLVEDAKKILGAASTPSPQSLVLARLFGVFTLIVFFWVAYEQNDNLWTFFARDHIAEKVVDPDTGREVETCVLRLGRWQKEFPPDGFQFINSLLILVLVPLAGLMWRKIDPQGTRFPPTRKILMGFGWTAAAAGVMSLASFQAAGGEKVTAWWMVLGYFVLTVGEILVYGTGLELSYTAAPQHMKGFVTACFLVTIGLGNLINTRLSPLYKKDIPEAQFFALTAVIVVVASIAFYFVGRRFTRGSAQEAVAEPNNSPEMP
jgi:POT family proton-dependent oligopeptide transporter